MKVQSIGNQNNQPNFKALYKVPVEDISNDVIDLVEKYNCQKCPSYHMAPKYWYILTPNTKKAEKAFEKAFLEHGGKFWKVKIEDVLNGRVCREIFNARKALDNGEETWVVGKAKQSLDIKF